jgi:hypothetical protein
MFDVAAEKYALVLLRTPNVNVTWTQIRSSHWMEYTQLMFICVFKMENLVTNFKLSLIMS